ncbi:MAG: glycoside hydrolase family 127 protein [Muribaculaceae bacterium]|nr:glycoside hydrolase family 127 protein [Muribaculaceae bacterium]
MLAQGWAVNPTLKATRLGGENMKRVEQNWQHLQQVATMLTDSVGKHQNDAELVADAAQVAFALSLETQALKEKSPALDSLMLTLIATLNPQSYWGKPIDGKLNESQMAVNGLLLKALCEYQRLHPVDSVKRHIHDMAHNLFADNIKQLQQYTPGASRPWWHKLLFWKRNSQNWTYSNPRGQLLEGMTGVMQACQVLRDTTLAPVIDAMVGSVVKIVPKTPVNSRFLTAALRLVLQWAERNQDIRLAQWVQTQFDSLVKNCLTASFEIADGDSHTSVTATADAFLLANDLWRFSADTRYLELAQLIYFNALCSMQTHKGDFVPHSIPTPSAPTLVAIPEATRESSAQGAEAITHLCRMATAVKADTLYVNHLATSLAGPKINGENISMLITSKFPNEECTADFMLLKQPDDVVTWKIFLPHWLSATKLTINQQPDSCVVDAAGFLSFKKEFEQYATISIAFADTSWYNTQPALEKKTSLRSLMHGPLLFAHRADSITTLPQKPSLQRQRNGNWKLKGSKTLFVPINHMMEPNALSPDRKRLQVLFPLSKQ